MIEDVVRRCNPRFLDALACCMLWASIRGLEEVTQSSILSIYVQTVVQRSLLPKAYLKARNKDAALLEAKVEPGG